MVISVAMIPRTARVGNNRNTIAGGQFPLHLADRAFLLERKGIGIIEEVIDALHANNAGLLEDRIVDGLGSRDGARMRGSGLGAGARPAGLDHQNRHASLAGGHSANDLDKAIAVPQLFNVNHDNRCIRIMVQVFEDIRLIHVGLVADGNELRKSEITVCREIEYRGAKRTAL